MNGAVFQGRGFVLLLPEQVPPFPAPAQVWAAFSLSQGGSAAPVWSGVTADGWKLCMKAKSTHFLLSCLQESTEATAVQTVREGLSPRL